MPKSAPPRPSAGFATRDQCHALGTAAREARELDINLSQACERGLALAVAETRKQRWLRENSAAIDGWNEYVDQHGLPLAAFRQF